MSTFRADCSKCCGLCCVVPDHWPCRAFSLTNQQKPLAPSERRHRCAIHATRQIHGYTACAAFDCFGAGQWITQTLFGGARWTQSSDLARQMFSAYRHWAPRFEAAAPAQAALPHVRDDARCSLVAKMTALTSETPDQRSPTDSARLRRETLAAIRSVLRIDKSFL